MESVFYFTFEARFFLKTFKIFYWLFIFLMIIVEKRLD